MQIRTLALVGTLVAAGMLAACSGGSTGGGGPTVTPPTQNPGGGGPDPNGYIGASISIVNSIGAPLQENLNPNDQAQPNGGSSVQSKTGINGVQLGVCQQLFGANSSSSFMFNSPANGQGTNSSEITRYNSANCAAGTLVADTVRSWTSGGSGTETVQFTASKWSTPSSSGSQPSAVRTGTITYTNAQSFTKYGDPVFQPGTTRTETSSVSTNGTVVTNGANEWIDGGVDASQPNSEFYCGAATGYNVVGDPTLNETFGWSSQTNGTNGIRTVNPTTGDVTFNATRVGNAYIGPIGFMSITTNAPNTACPIATPEYVANVTGGYKSLSFNVPISYTFNSGFLKSVTISSGTLSGYTLTANTNNPSNKLPLIQGQVSTAAGTPIANFNINMNGFGSLQMIGGSQYSIVDWHIIN